MKIHEYQAKELLKSYGVAVPRGVVAVTPSDARRAAEEIGGQRWVVKAQIHAGGRGKAGGVRLASSLEEVEGQAEALLGHTLVTPQTGPHGRTVKKVLVEEALEVAQELYAALTVDRASSRVVLLMSTAGGVEIEEVIGSDPSLLGKEPLRPDGTLSQYQIRRLGKAIGLSVDLSSRLWHFVSGMCRAFHAEDCQLLEINPLGITSDGQPVAMDVKIILDDNASFRHPHWNDWLDPNEEDPTEFEARNAGISYIRLGGTIGCLVNGAGLAMATMDLIKSMGGEPANFLDVGGGASEESIRRALEIILSDEKIKSVLVNIFGGIMRCDVVAQALVKALRNMDMEFPVIVRLQGTNVEDAWRILRESGLKLKVAEHMEEAAGLAVELGRQ
jgi:succinyl-CoA synthetase beta subunit